MRAARALSPRNAARQAPALQWHRGVRELRPGLWHWEAPHPDWTAREPWQQMVSSYAVDDGERLLLFDPLAQKFGITREQAAGGSPDVAWLLAGDVGELHLYRSGERVAVGVEAFAGREPNDMVLWIEGSRAVISGDTLVDFGRGLEINGWLRAGVTREQVVEGLRPLLDLPVDVVLATHGGPTDRTALERALS